MAFQKILCPIDFSKPSTAAMRVAVRLAANADAELVLAHSWFLPPLALGAGVEFPADVIQGMVDDGARALEATLAEAKALGARRATALPLTGVPWQSIVEALAADAAFDLVVMSTHGRTGLERLLLGSVAEQVVRHAPCSVLAVRGADTGTYRHVMCPVDLSEGSRTALAVAERLVSPSGGTIALVHVVELPSAYAGELVDPRMLEALDAHGTEQLVAWAAAASVPAVTRTRAGSPVGQILATLDEDPTFDLVVIGSHGRTGIRRLVLGSVAESVVRHAACSVLVARARA